MGSEGTENVPVSLVTTGKVAPVATALTSTLAPGMTPPLASTTMLESDDVAPPCAYARVLTRHTNTSAASGRRKASFMFILQGGAARLSRRDRPGPTQTQTVRI